MGWPGGISEAYHTPMAPSSANKDAQLAFAAFFDRASAAILCIYRIDCIGLICSCRESQGIHQTIRTVPAPSCCFLLVRARPLPACSTLPAL